MTQIQRRRTTRGLKRGCTRAPIIVIYLLSRRRFVIGKTLFIRVGADKMKRGDGQKMPKSLFSPRYLNIIFVYVFYKTKRLQRPVYVYVHVVHNARVHNSGVLRHNKIRPGRDFFCERTAAMNNSTRGLLINRTAISLFIFISLILSETIIYGRTFVLRYKRKSRTFFFFLFMFIPLKRGSRFLCDCSRRQIQPRPTGFILFIPRPTTVRRRDFSTTEIKIVRFCADGLAGRSRPVSVRDTRPD